jgi:hypothetical protein
MHADETIVRFRFKVCYFIYEFPRYVKLNVIIEILV